MAEKKVLINVRGLEFSKADSLKERLAAVDGIEQVNVHAAKEGVYVVYTDTTLAKIEQKIRDFGLKIVYDQAKFLVSGLHSADSARPLEKVLSVEGVKSIHFDFAKSCVIVSYNSSLIPKPVDIITASGYRVVEVGSEGWKQLQRKQLKVQFGLFLFALLFSVPIALWSYTALPFPETMIKSLVLFLLATPVVCVCGYQYYVGAYRALRHKIVTRDVLVSVAVVVGYTYSVAQTFFVNGVVLYAATTLIVTVVTFGRFVEIWLKPKILPAVHSVGDVSFVGVQKLLDTIPTTPLAFDKRLRNYYPYFSLFVLLLAVITFFVWFGSGILTALLFALAVLVIVNPSLIVLAAPTMLVSGLGVAMNYGIVFRSAGVIEKVASVSVVIFDKIGTLSKGHKFSEVIPVDGDEKETLKWAATAVSGVDYSLRDQILAAAKDARVFYHRPDKHEVFGGHGIKASYVDKKIELGRVEHEKAKSLEKEGKTVLGVILDSKLLGLLTFVDERKQNTKLAVRALKNMGIKTIMSTPETKRVGAVSAADLGVDQVIERHELGEKLNRLKEQGRVVAFIGEGKHEGVDVYVGSGSDNDVVLASDSIKDVVAVFQIGRALIGRVKWNVYGVLLYNLLALVLAVGALNQLGVKLHPVYAALVAVVAGVLVFVHSLSFKRFVPAVKKYWGEST